MLAPVLEIILIQTESLTEQYQLPKNIFVTVSKAIVTKQRQAVNSQLLSPSSKVYVFKKYTDTTNNSKYNTCIIMDCKQE